MTPTNHAAKRAIRPAVVVRKISAGNRSTPGARVHAIVTSLWQTCRQQDQDFLHLVTTLLRKSKPAAVPLVPSQPPTAPP